MSLLHRNKAEKIRSSLFSASPLWPRLKGKKHSQLEWTAVASSVCGFYLIDCWVKEKAEWDHVLQQACFRNIYVYRGQTADVNEKPRRSTRLSWWCSLPGGGWVLGASMNPTEGTVRSFVCHPSIHLAIHPDGGFILEFPEAVTQVNTRERAALAVHTPEWRNATTRQNE